MLPSEMRRAWTRHSYVFVTFPVTCAGGTKGLSSLWHVYPADLGLSNTTYNAAKIVILLFNVFPDVLTHMDRAGASLLHRFCWIEHLSSSRAKQALEVERGIRGPLRKPMRKNVYDPLHVLEAIYLSARRHWPRILQETDRKGALPLHYLCQNKGQCAARIIRRMIELDMHSTVVTDINRCVRIGC